MLGDIAGDPAVYYKRMYRSSPDSGIYSDDHDGVDLWKYHQSDSQVAGSSAERRRRQSEFWDQAEKMRDGTADAGIWKDADPSER